MSLLEGLADDIADILGSDNEETSRKSPSKSKLVRQKIESQDIASEDESLTTNKDDNKNNASEKQLMNKKSKTKRRKSMLESQSNQSLHSAKATIPESSAVAMSREQALSLLQSESQKNLHKSKSSQSITKQSNSDINQDFDDFEFELESNNKSHNTSDNDSNDSILDWLDEPRVRTQNVRKPLLPTKLVKTQLNNATSVTEKTEKTEQSNGVKPESKTEKVSETTDIKQSDIEQWNDWLGLSADNKDDKEFLYLAENAAKTALPLEWEKVNENLYRNVRTNEKTMTHPLLSNIQNQLESLRKNKKQKSVPLRQISTHYSEKAKSKINIETVSNISKNRNDSKYTKQSESLMINNLKMELSDTRNKLKKSMNDKTRLLSEIEEMNHKTEIMINAQKQRLLQSHQMEMSQLQTENAELRTLNSKLMSEYETELINLETNHQRNGIKQKQQRLNEMTLIEQRGRNELLHSMELHRNTIQELKKQHSNEIEILSSMHQKQLKNLRQQNRNQSQLDFLITKMETSTLSLDRLQKDFEHERDGKCKEISIKQSELSREKAANFELLKRFQSLIEETKIEKIRIREIEDKLKSREDQILADLSRDNRQISTQRDLINEERKKLELSKSRWEKQRQIECEDMQRLKNEHNGNIKIFFEEQEIERKQISKQRQILNEDKSKYINQKKEFGIGKEHWQNMKMAFEERKHKFEMKYSDFERKVQSMNTLSQRVYEQSEVIQKMHSNSMRIEEENNVRQIQLISQQKELKVVKEQILMERKCLEQQQLTLLTTKREMIQQIDNIKSFSNHKAQKSPMISNELKELKEFVNECNQNISNYKQYLNSFKNKKRESIMPNNDSKISALHMSFPSRSYNNSKSSSFISTSIQHSRSRSLKSFIKSKQNMNESGINNLSKIDIAHITPKKSPKRKCLNVSSNTDSTLQSSFVSMANIDTPITIDMDRNKSKPRLNVTKDSTMPMTPTPMPNLSKICISEEDNQEFENDSNDINDIEEYKYNTVDDNDNENDDEKKPDIQDQ